MSELIKTSAEGLTEEQGKKILALAEKLGDELGDFLDRAIDDIFEKIEKEFNKNQ